MISNLSKVEVRIGERVYQLICAADSPLGEVHDALTMMRAEIIEKMQEMEKPATEEVQGE